MTPNDLHALLVHLLHGGGALWVPGAKPNGEAVMFEPEELPVLLPSHPTNSAQTPVLRGQVIGLAARPYWCVAIAHLAHARGCEQCEPVWRTAAEQWAAVPDRAALFTAIDMGPPDEPPGALLVHAHDIPPPPA